MSAVHPFEEAPNRTLLHLSVPVLFSLIAEPLTGLVDTAFIAQLGATELAALGVGTMALSSVFWIFNFLGIGTQTEVAQADGNQDRVRVAQLHRLAGLMALGIGALLLVVGWPLTGTIAQLLGAENAILDYASEYMHIRWLGAPAILVTIAAFGTMRGLQDMRTPLWIAVLINALNIILDPLLIFGLGPVPALGIEGAAIASVISQWVGAVLIMVILRRRLPTPPELDLADASRLVKIGGDLFIRTGSLTLFLLLTTRIATKSGAESGAAHQAIRQVWTFMALFLDAFAISGQSLVGYFIGARRMEQALRVASVVCWWSLGTGALLAVLMLLGTDLVARILVPASAVGLFGPAWVASAIAQPLNAVSFGTDGIHWGTGDFRYLRNAMVAATSVGVVGLWAFVDPEDAHALTAIWYVTMGWITLRAAFGLVRIWPGWGRAPLRAGTAI